MPDSRVQAAIENWAPRFTAQGVDYNDFVRTTAQIERWENWLDAWCENAEMHLELAQDAELRGWTRTAGEAYVRAALSYHFAKFVWMVDLEKHRSAADRAVACLCAAHRHLDPRAERLEVNFEGHLMVANLRRPPDEDHPPVVLLLPGLDSTKEEFFHWENVFLVRGMATISMEGPGQGETGYETHIRPDYENAVRSMLDTLVWRDDLDHDRIGAVGVSLGGYYAPRAAAFEPRLKAAVAIGGPFNFGECWGRLPQITRETFIHHSGARDEAEAEQLAHQLTLEEIAGEISQPLLVVMGQQDRLIPWRHAERLATEAPFGELLLYPEGNHVCNNIPYKYRPRVADWLWEQLS